MFHLADIFTGDGRISVASPSSPRFDNGSPIRATFRSSGGRATSNDLLFSHRCATRNGARISGALIERPAVTHSLPVAVGDN